MTNSVRFWTCFEAEDEESEFHGKTAVVEITRDQAAAVAWLYDELAAVAAAWSARPALEDSGLSGRLFIEGELTLALPFVVGPPGEAILGREEMKLEIAPPAAFDDPPLVTWGVRVDTGWRRVYVYAAGAAQAPLPLAGLRRHFGLEAAGAMPSPGEPVQLILNGERGPKGDRWLAEPVGGGLPSIIKDELVAGWQRRPVGAA